MIDPKALDRASFMWRWVNRSGLYLTHKDLTADQILNLYGQECLPCHCGEDGCEGWQIRTKGPDDPNAKAVHR
jgi:hypothetical protein